MAMNEITDGLPAFLGTQMPYPQCLTALTQSAVNDAAERYLATLRELSADAKHVTDKMPHNFKHLGMIALLFPAARVIHCKAQPDRQLLVDLHL